MPQLVSSSPKVHRGVYGFALRSLDQIYAGRRRFATGAAAVLAVGLGYHVIFGQNGLTAYEQKRQNTVILDRELSVLGRENELLKGHVERLQNDPSAIEHQAREELHYARPGEVIYTLPVKPGVDQASHPAPIKATDN
jgi:cell division protein FtsB